MFRTVATAGIAALLLGTAVFAQDAKTVKSIEVETDLSAIGNSSAAAYWKNISTDLEAAIAARVANNLSEDGIKLVIDIEEVELSNGFQETLGLADTKLSGLVKMTHENDNGRFSNYRLTVDINQAMPLIPAGTDVTTLPADTRVYYDAMINTFANAVVERLT
jgi:hypothetical protein